MINIYRNNTLTRQMHSDGKKRRSFVVVLFVAGDLRRYTLGDRSMWKLIAPLFLWFFFSHAATAATDTLEDWRSYAVYENGYEARRLIEEGILGEGTKFKQCAKQADHSSWRGFIWSENTIRKAEYIFFYGCFIGPDKKLTKELFLSRFGG